MKKILYLFFLLLPFISKAQFGIITTVDSLKGWNYAVLGGGSSVITEMVVDATGNVYGSNRLVIIKITPSGITSDFAGVGTFGFSGDGGPATNAQIGVGWNGKLAVDSAGNLYFTDAENYRVRKVNTSGIITTIAGIGVSGFSGDGGPATSAQLFFPKGIAIDKVGNKFIGDSNRIRMIDTAGIITTVAGIGLSIGAFDGMPATNAAFTTPLDLAFDGVGNLFFLTDSFICKIDTTGIVHLITRCTQYWWSDALPSTPSGSPAVSAVTEGVFNMDVDVTGNVYLASRASNVIRKVSTDGVISTIIGTAPLVSSTLPPCAPWLGDGIAATSALLCLPAMVCMHPSGTLYFTTEGSSLHRLCKVAYPLPPPPPPTTVLDKFSSISEIATPTLQPNPATNMLTIKANGEIYNTYAITNSSGKIVMEDQFTIPYTNINIRPLPAGVYYIKLVGNKGTVVRKFTKI